MKTFWMGLAATCIGLVGCASDDPTPGASSTAGPVMVTVDGKPISEALFSYYSRSRAQKEPTDLSQEEHDALLEELVQLVLLSNAADSAGLAGDPDFAAELELQRLQTVARKQISEQLDADPATEAELEQAYEANLEQFAGVQYKARHILVEEESEAREIIAELERGADFQELARTRSTGPSGPNGGDLGWFSADRMVPPFAAAVRSMQVGSYTNEPVQTRFGWHVILLEDKSDGRAPGLEAVREDVTNIVQQEKVQSYLEHLKARASINQISNLSTDN
jgi:peptidyl-prolyl cis-trans isomerase C